MTFSIGINLASAAKGTEIFPTLSQIKYFVSKGMTSIRLALLWERMQPTLGAGLSTTEANKVLAFLNDCATADATAIIDIHNYGAYGPNIAANKIGGGTVTQAHFADLWSRMATAFSGHAALEGYDIMNEPSTMPNASVWPAAAQAAVAAIRAVDTVRPIYVEGDAYAGTAQWATYNSGLNISDPSNNIIYSAHCYFDATNQGLYATSYDQDATLPTIGATRLAPFTSWLTAHGFKGHIGEFGVPDDDPRWLTVLANFVAAVKTANIPCHYWEGTAASSYYPLALLPIGGQDRRQMPTLVEAIQGSGPPTLNYSTQTFRKNNQPRRVVLTGSVLAVAGVNQYENIYSGGVNFATQYDNSDLSTTVKGAVTGVTLTSTLSGVSAVKGADVFSYNPNRNVTFTGGVAGQTFVAGCGVGKVTITDFANGVLQCCGGMFVDCADALARSAQVGADTVLSSTAGDTITLKNYLKTGLSAANVAVVP